MMRREKSDLKIFFAASIRGGLQNSQFNLAIVESLQCHGIVLTEHMGSDALNAMGQNWKDSQSIRERDLRWLEMADLMVAEVTQPSIGVGYQIAIAEGKMPILCLYKPHQKYRLSVFVEGNPNVVVMEYSTINEAEQLIDRYMHKIKRDFHIPTELERLP